MATMGHFDTDRANRGETNVDRYLAEEYGITSDGAALQAVVRAAVLSTRHAIHGIVHEEFARGMRTAVHRTGVLDADDILAHARSIEGL